MPPGNSFRGQRLIDRMKRANRTIKDSEEELTKLLDSLPAPVRREDVAEWANQEEEWTAGVHNTVEQPSWKHGYVIYLKMFYEIHSKWEQASEPETCNAAVVWTVEQVGRCWLIWRAEMALLGDGPLPVRNISWPEMLPMTEMKKWP